MDLDAHAERINCSGRNRTILRHRQKIALCLPQLRRSPHHQRRFQHRGTATAGWRFFEEAGDHGGSTVANLCGSLVDAGQGNAQFAAVMKVTAADDGHVARNAQTELVCPDHRSSRNGIVKAEESVRPWLHGEYGIHRLPAARLSIGVCRVIRGDDIVLWNAEAMFSHCVPIALGSLIADIGRRSAEVSDALAALRDEVLGGEFSDSVVIDANEVAGKALETSIEQNQRDSCMSDHPEIFSIFLAGRDDEAIEAVGKHVFDLVLFQGWIALGGRDEEEVVFLAQGGGERFGDLGEEGMNQVGHDQADQ